MASILVEDGSDHIMMSEAAFRYRALVAQW